MTPSRQHAPHTRPRNVRAPLSRPSRRALLHTLAGLTLVTGALLTGAPSASAYDCPRNTECHFIRISQKGLPSWAAKMRMYNTETDETYHQWKEDYGRWGKAAKSGAYASWWWSVPPQDETTALDVYIESANIADGETDANQREWTLDPHQDHCFQISAFGERKWTGSGIHDGSGKWIGQGAPCKDD